MKQIKHEEGITLIALIITVVVLAVLSVTAIRFTIGNNGIIDTTKRAKTDTALGAKGEEVQLAINSLMLENNGDKRRITVSAVQEKIRTNYASQEAKNAIIGTAIRDEEESEENTFPGIITYGKAVSGVNKDIVVTIDENLKVVDIEIGSKIMIASSAYKSTNNVYCCSPDITKFNKKKTYYVTYDVNGNETIEGRLDKVEEPENWYDYGNKKWANIVMIDNGRTSYWTWIPRYKYKITEGELDLKFVNKSDECTIMEDGVEKTKDVSDYDLPEAFEFNQVPLSGYWVSKYEIKEDSTSSIAKGVKSSTTLKIESCNGTGPYSVYINGVKKFEHQTIPFTTELRGRNNDVWLWDEGAKTVITPVIVDQGGAIEVDLRGFNTARTYYVLYDDDGNESIGDLIQIDEEGNPSNEPESWYDYLNKKWANVVTVDNGRASYWTYIPRYEYSLYNSSTVRIEYISETQEEADEGFVIPEAFAFNDKPLKGYWVSKYEITEDTKSSVAKGIRNSTTLKMESCNGTGPYSVYINGQKRAEHKEVPFTMDIPGKDYDIWLWDEGARKIITPVIIDSGEAIAIDLSGFSTACTYYVEYDDNGGESVGDLIELDEDGKLTNAPEGWYDYVNKKWANVVTIDSDKTTYWTYIPRYEYAMYNENTIHIVYIPETQDEADEGFVIPEAFTFNEIPLAGYWVSKYEIQE